MTCRLHCSGPVRLVDNFRFWSKCLIDTLKPFNDLEGLWIVEINVRPLLASFNWLFDNPEFEVPENKHIPYIQVYQYTNTIQMLQFYGIDTDRFSRQRKSYWKKVVYHF